MRAKQFPYFGNASSKILHTRGTRGDGCSVSELKRSNVENFQNIQQAKRYGYRLCLRCRFAKDGK